MRASQQGRLSLKAMWVQMVGADGFTAIRGSRRLAEGQSSTSAKLFGVLGCLEVSTVIRTISHCDHVATQAVISGRGAQVRNQTSSTPCDPHFQKQRRVDQADRLLHGRLFRAPFG